MNTLRRLLIGAILLSAFVAVYSLEDHVENNSASAKSTPGQDLTGGSDSEMARRRRHRFGHHLCKKFFCDHSALVVILFVVIAP